jgi:hypothetical protein
MQHSSRTVMTERTLSLLYTIPQADEVTMRKEYFSHLYLICGCYSTNGRQEQSEPGGKKLALHTLQGSSFPWHAVPEVNLLETFAPCASEMEKADNTDVD